MGVVVTVGALDARGPIVAAVAAVLWAGLTVVARRPLSEVIAAGRAHPVLDSWVMPPAVFVAVATLTRLGLGWCALVAVASWLALLALVAARRRGGAVGAGPMLAFAVVAVAAFVGLGTPSAHARFVNDQDIGWPAALRADLGLKQLSARPCRLGWTGATRRRQQRVQLRAPRNRLYTIFHDRPNENMWGTLWTTPCDGGRQQVAVASTGTPRNTRRAVARARRYLRTKGLSRDVRLVAVRSTYRQLLEAGDALGATFATQVAAGVVATGVEVTRNALEIEVSAEATAEDRQALRRYARDAPVNVLLRFEPPRDPNAPVDTYEGWLSVDRSTLRRDSRDVTVAVEDMNCGGDETFDSAARLDGVTVRRAGQAFVLTARFRVNPAWPEASACEGSDDPRLSATTTVRLPGPLGRRGIVDGAEGPGGFRHVAVPPLGASAIRSLVPRFVYSREDCDAGPVRRAFRGRATSDWCFF